MLSDEVQSLILLLVSVVLLLIQTQAQEAQQLDCSAPQIDTLLNEINRLRLERNQPALKPNPILCEIAFQHAIDLATRPANQVGDPGRRADGSSVTDWIRDPAFAAFRPYPADGRSGAAYAINLSAFVSNLYGPDQALPQTGWNTDKLIFSDIFREIGLAYVYNVNVNRHHYVLVVGARPNVLPVIAVDPVNKFDIIDRSPLAQVSLIIHNEKFRPLGSVNYLGALAFIHISQSPPAAAQDVGRLIPCDDLAKGARQNYFPFLDYIVTGGVGEHTIYVRMCDGIGNMIITPLTIYVESDTLPGETDLQTAVAATLTAFSLAEQPLRDATATARAQIQETRIAEQVATSVAGLTATAQQQQTATARVAVADAATQAAVSTAQAVAQGTLDTLATVNAQLTGTVQAAPDAKAVVATPTPTPVVTTVTDVWAELVWNDRYLLLTNLSRTTIRFNSLGRLGLVATPQLNIYISRLGLVDGLDLRQNTCLLIARQGNALVSDPTATGLTSSCQRILNRARVFKVNTVWLQDFEVRFAINNRDFELLATCQAATGICLLPRPDNL